MVLSEVAKDPPSPFVTVQSTCDVLLPTVPDPAAQQHSPQPWHSTNSCSPHVHTATPDGVHRTHLQSIVSQQPLNFSVPPDSPFEFEQALNSISASGAPGDAQHSKHQQAAAAAGHGDITAQASVQRSCDMPAQADNHKHRALRFLPLNGTWLRPTQSVPTCSHNKRQQPAALQDAGISQELSLRTSVVLDKQQMLGKKLKSRVHKLLAWASGSKGPSAPDSAPAGKAQLMSVPLGGLGSLSFSPAATTPGLLPQQQPQQPGVPVPWQHQVFTEPSVHLINATPGSPAPLRSPRTSLVSTPSSCDCPLLLGRYSSTGSEGGYGRSPGPAATCSSGLSCSQSCSLNTTPSPGKASGGGAAPVSSVINGCVAGATAPDAHMLKRSGSVRGAHHRHRQHRPGCRFHPHQLQQQQTLTFQQQAQAQQSPSSPSIGGLTTQSSLRTALQQLESMASVKAQRIMDRLNAGLQRMTSHRLFDGVLRHGTVGKEVMRDWELGPPLGMGSSCVTRLVIEKTSGRTAACKSISKQGILHSAVVKAALLAVQREVAILQAVVGHPHVVALHAVYEDVNNLHMIMDWCGGGSLWDLMERCPGYRLPEHAAAAATKATLEVLAHCHARGVMHRDIKPDNLLVARPLEGPQQLTADLIKVTDFGISVPFTQGQVLTELAGTMGYMAPEVLKRDYSEQADVWSAGVMLYEMVAGCLPFNLGNSFEESLANIEGAEPDLSGAAWQAVSADARELVSAMLAKDPRLRPSAQKLLDNYSSWLSCACQEQQQQSLERG